MRRKVTKLFRWIWPYVLLTACVERIYFEIPPAQDQLVIEGSITTDLGPYEVKISTALNLDADSTAQSPVSGAQVTLFDDQGNVEDLVATDAGVYRTTGIIRGEVGRSYSIRVTLADGNVFESEPDMLYPVGEVTEIHHEFEARTVEKPYGTVAANVFNIYVDADAGLREENYVRWKFNGTYKVVTYPELYMRHVPPYRPWKDPWPCSGYILVGGPEGSGGILLQVDTCECCTCWVRQNESIPQVSDNQLVKGNSFKRVKVGEVPITNATFHEKYLVEVEQYSLSRGAFEFFQLVKDQKVNAASLFQPPLGEFRGNIKAVNNTQAVVGIFWASAVARKSIYLLPSDVPYPVVPIDFITLPCYDFYDNATSIKPANWE